MSNNITTRKQRVDLNAEQRAQIMRQFFDHGEATAELAEFYDVCEATIHAITKPRRLELKKSQHLQEAMKLRKAISKAKPRAGGVVRSKKNLVKEDHPDQNLSVSWMSSESDAFITGMSIAYGLSRAQVVDKLIDIAKAQNATKQN